MGRPSIEQIAEAIVYSARHRETDAQFENRLAELHRLSDAELAAMGIFPPAWPEPADGLEPPSASDRSRGNRQLARRAGGQSRTDGDETDKTDTPRIRLFSLPRGLRRARQKPVTRLANR